jgi:hypothetical protein
MGAQPCARVAHLCGELCFVLRSGRHVAAAFVQGSGGSVTATAFANRTDPVVRVEYGQGAVPMFAVYDADTDLPLLPFVEDVRAG